MRIHSIGVAGVRGVDVGWEWRPLAVLFGPNDSSKTNILEVLLALLSSDPGELRK
jgi:predicted ATP-dependent endonuclease of OLD family